MVYFVDSNGKSLFTDGNDIVQSIDIEVNDILSVMTSIDISDNGYAFLVDQNGLIIRHKHDRFAPDGDITHSIYDIKEYPTVSNEVKCKLRAPKGRSYRPL